MKLNGLTDLERECYDAWGDGFADHRGGDCQDSMYAWAAFDDERVILLRTNTGS